MSLPFTAHRINLPNALAGKDTHEIVFYDWGDPLAEHTVVCVHGLTRNARDFDLLAEELASRGRRVMAFSMAGRGESARLENTLDYNYFSYASDCLKILDNFHLRQVDWVGTSMGGIIGMLVAAEHEGRIRKLVLNDIGTLLKKEALVRIYQNVTTMPARFASRAEADAWLKQAYGSFGIPAGPLWERFVDTSLIADGDGFILACDPKILDPLRESTKDFTEIEDVNIAELWLKIGIPTLILRGETSDILDPETVNAMRSTNSRAEARTIEGVGHAPSLMVPDQIKLVADWLMAPAIRLAGL